jgi:imidazolonepropionase
MAELGVVPHGALLIRNGIIREAGPTRRVENLAEARNAVEIDASGRVVMPVFVNPDAAVVSAASPDDVGPDSLSRMSNRRIRARAFERSAEYARYGCVTAGAHTRCAADLRNIRRLLRAHHQVQRTPMRIVSVFSPLAAPELVEEIASAWLPAVMTQKLATIVELTAGGPGRVPDMTGLRKLVAAAAGCGYAVRLRSPWRLESAHLELALASGALAVVAPMDSLRGFSCRLTDAGTIRVLPVSDESGGGASRAIRAGIRNGAAIALSPGCGATVNMQHVLCLGVERFGLTPEEAITATTWNASCSLRLSNMTGSLEPGKAADLLVMEAGDYRELAHAGHADASLVMREGRIVYRRRSSLSPD